MKEVSDLPDNPLQDLADKPKERPIKELIEEAKYRSNIEHQARASR
jgi:hypothetical protein